MNGHMASGGSRADVEPLERRRLLTAGNVLVGVSGPNFSIVYDVIEYTQSGQQVRTAYAPGGAGGLDHTVKDFVVDAGGDLQVYQGGFPPDGTVTTVSLQGAVVGQHTVAGMNLIGRTFYGGIAANRRYLFVADMSQGGDRGPNQRGLIRFDTLNGFAAERFATDVDMQDVTVGLDGKVYGLVSPGGQPMAGQVRVYDPITLALLRTVPCPGYDDAGVAADAAGNLYIGSFATGLYKTDPAGNVLKTLNFGATDVDLSTDGKLLAAGGGVVKVLDADLNELSSFTTSTYFGCTFAAWATPQIPPADAALEVRSIVTGADAGGPPQVRAWDPVAGQFIQDYLAFAPGFLGGVRVAEADVTGDGTPDVIAGAGVGSSHVKVFDGATGQRVPGPLGSFLAFPGAGGSASDPTSDYYRLSFTGGVYVAGGDVDGDGRDDVIVAAGAGGPPHVKVYSGITGQPIRSIFAYAPGFLGGVRVAAGDVDGDGRADIVTGTGAAGPHVRVFSGADMSLLASYFAFAAGYQRGIFVGAGDTDGDGRDEVLVSTGVGPPHVKVFALTSFANPTPVASFYAYPMTFLGGVRVAAGDVDGDGRDEVLTATGPGDATVKAFAVTRFTNLSALLSYLAADGTDGVFVAGR